MEIVSKRQWGSLAWSFVMVQFFLLSHCSVKYSQRNISTNKSGGASNIDSVSLVIKENDVEINNGIVHISVSRPSGNIWQIKYQGLENLLDRSLDNDDRGYWDCAWEDVNGSNGKQTKISGTKFEVITQNNVQVEVSFKTTWNPSDPLPALNVDKRYVMLRGSSGFYTYAIYERYQGWPGMFLWENRIVFKLSQERFQYMAISDTRQRIMPTSADRERGQPLAYPEAVLVENPRGSALNEEVDDKYQYSSQSIDDRVHGWISLDSGVGLWIITPSYEFRTSGPHKQDLTCHVGPICLAMFMSAHYSGATEGVKFENGEPWKKVFGPVFIYLNSVSDKSKALSLWNDAKQQMQKEVESWPYSFPQSPDFLKLDQRGSVTGYLSVQDQYLTNGNGPAKLAYVGLAVSGDVGSWELEVKNYQFWTQTNEQGHFIIKAVLPGSYNLHAWVPGVMGNYMYEVHVDIAAGSNIELPPLVFHPPRNGPTLWEIGVPDRSAAEFYVPSAIKNINSLYLKQDMFRQYGLWERYGELYPTRDLVFTIGTSDYTRGWFYAHVLRNVRNGELQTSIWQIVFDLLNVDSAGTYKLRLELAAANLAEVQVRVNPTGCNVHPHFSTGLTGKDNAIARHGIHGLQYSFTADLPGSLFVVGSNTIFLEQPRKQSIFQGVMYDYIRLEGPPSRH